MNRTYTNLRQFVFWIAVFLLPSSVMAERNNEWAQYEIKLSSKGQLSDVFDSGLRPYRFPSLEKSELEVKHVSARIVTPSGEKLPVFDGEQLQISVQSQGLLSALEFRNSGISLLDSRTEMLKWIGFGKEPYRSVAELDLFLEAVSKDPRGYNYGPNGISHDFQIQWRDKDNILYGVWFRNCRNPQKPLAIQMAIGFPRLPLEASSFYDIPIPPPPGYENVDMTAPKDFGPDTPPDDPEIERIRKAGVMPDYSMLPKEKIRSGVLPPGHTAMPPPPPQRAAPPEPRVIATTPELPAASSSTWLWWVGGLAVLVLPLIANSLRKRR